MLPWWLSAAGDDDVVMPEAAATTRASSGSISRLVAGASGRLEAQVVAAAMALQGAGSAALLVQAARQVLIEGFQVGACCCCCGVLLCTCCYCYCCCCCCCCCSVLLLLGVLLRGYTGRMPSISSGNSLANVTWLPVWRLP
jgi:hypothetical protein